MKKEFSNKEFNKILLNLSDEYDIYAPVTNPFKGTFSDTDLVKYEKVNSFDEINFTEKSYYSPKEILLPMRETLFYFNEKEFIKPKGRVKKALVFLRSCDLHGIDRVDNIYINNKFQDEYYIEAKKMIKYVVIGCKDKGWDTCFCASMGTNENENYNIGLTLKDKSVLLDIKDDSLKGYFNEGLETEFQMEFVSENKEKVTIPENINLEDIINDDMWREYDRCIKCGRCNFVCPTCTCFTTQDIFNKDNSSTGERRRVWASCHVDGFSTMAGGHEFRQKSGDRMRFKVMHKISDYKKRFGEHMCIGCGRCDDACPEYISYINCINKLSKKLGDKNEK